MEDKAWSSARGGSIVQVRRRSGPGGVDQGGVLIHLCICRQGTISNNVQVLMIELGRTILNTVNKKH